MSDRLFIMSESFKVMVIMDDNIEKSFLGAWMLFVK